MKKIVSVSLSMVVGFFSAMSLDVKVEALNTDIISQAYWGNYYNQTDDTYLISITGETSISFRGVYQSVTMAANTPTEIYFSPIADGNFEVTFSKWSRLNVNYFVPQVGTKQISAYYDKYDCSFKMDAGSTYHYYIEE